MFTCKLSLLDEPDLADSLSLPACTFKRWEDGPGSPAQSRSSSSLSLLKLVSTCS